MRAAKAPDRPWAAYARISVDKDESVSVKGQKASVERWAKAYGHRLVWFIDEGVSGSKDVKRRDRDDMERRLAEGEFAGVVVKAVDRLARNVRDFVRLAEVAKAAGGSVVVVEGGIDTGTDAGNMMMQLLSVFAEFEAKQIAARQRVSQEVRRQQGRALGRPSFGFTNRHDEQGAWRIVHAEQAKAIRKIADWLCSGSSLGDAARRANDAALPSPSGKRWTGEAVGAVMRNPAINGQIPRGDDVERGVDGRPVRNSKLQILDDAKWRELQAAIEQRSAHRFAPARHRPLLLTGVVRCSGCDGPMSRSSANRDFPLYRCTRGANKGCSNPVTIGAKKLETFINDFIALIEDIELPVIRRQEDPALRAELAEITETIERIVQSMSTATADEVGALATQLAQLKEQQAVVVQRLESEQVEVVESLGYSPALAWREGDDEIRRSLVPVFFTRILIGKAQDTATPVEDRLTIWAPMVKGPKEGVLVWRPGCVMPMGPFESAA